MSNMVLTLWKHQNSKPFPNPFPKLLKLFPNHKKIYVPAQTAHTLPQWLGCVWHLCSGTFHTPCPWPVFTPITHLTPWVHRCHTQFSRLYQVFFFKTRMKFKHFSRPWRAQSKFHLEDLNLFLVSKPSENHGASRVSIFLVFKVFFLPNCLSP